MLNNIMKTKLLKKLRKKYHILFQEVHIFKIMYSIRTLEKCDKNDPLLCKFSTYSYDIALEKQRELIINEIR